MADILSSWPWKEEPVSPVGFPDLDYEVADTWRLFEDEKVQQHEKTQKTTHKQEKPAEPSRAEVASKLLQDLDEWIKEEPFSDWLEEKIDLPIFAEVQGLESRIYNQNFQDGIENCKPMSHGPTLVPVMTVSPIISTPSELKSLPVPQMMVPQDTQTLLREFETVFGEVEMNHGTLTPPQSPPIPTYTNIIPETPKTAELITLQQMVPIQSFQSLQPAQPPLNMKMPISSLVPIIYASERKENLLPLVEQMVPQTPSPELVRELAVVDELVRTRVEGLVDIGGSDGIPDPWESCSSGNVSGASSGAESEGETSAVSPPSPCTSSSGSSYGSGEEMCDDPEWIPTSIQLPTSGCMKNGRKRAGISKPYSRPGVEEKRIRKKEQNKNAATRYRQKKKAEIEEILSEEKDLEEKNSELQLKVSDLSREIKYLKGLMRDLFKAKGLIK
ncbi:activating transcription factor of chaperone isoform X2 [Periplaneta americana]|uniref:activating transcription factor of chaperone isoform X2 n=1 Tax=Periplaneta americana TaxID=6978 RepID=UPI0037E86E7F